MKIVLLNTFESGGGAAIACKRLQEALNANGAEARMLVRSKTSGDPLTEGMPHRAGMFRFLRERLGIFCRNGFSKRNLFALSTADTGFDLSRHPWVREADIIHLHWINQGFLSLHDIQKLIATGKPVVWTMHDMWPVTAICHHAERCERYTVGCGECPKLNRPAPHDLSYRVGRQKEFLNGSGIRLVPVSRWLQERAGRSSFTGGLASTVIPNTLDTKRFRITGREAARQKLGLTPDDPVIVCGAAKLNDPIKGFTMLRTALGILTERKPEWKERMTLLLFGNIKNDDAFLNDMPVRTRWMGMLPPEEIVTLYNAADATVVPSYYETFGQTLSESMACGTPGVAFDNGGQRDIIGHETDGYLAFPYDCAELAKGIAWAVEHRTEPGMAEKCREKAIRLFAPEAVAQRYINEIYGPALNRDPH